MTSPGVLALRGGALGDFVLSLPHIFALQETFGKLTIGTHAKYIPFLRLLGLGHDHWPLDSAETTRRLYAEPAEGFDGVVSWLTARPHHPTVVGGRFNVFVSAPDRSDRHVADSYWDSLRTLGIRPIDPPDLRLRFREVSEDPGGEPFLVVHPGSGSDWKRWPLEFYLELVGSLMLSGLFKRAFVMVGPEDHRWSGSVQTLDWPPGVTFFESDDLVRTAGLLSRASLYIGNDSGVTHLSGLLGVPTIGIYGPTAPAVWGARGRRVTHVCTNSGCEECAPADAPKCSDRKCLRKITPAGVCGVAEGILGARTGD